MTTSQTVLLEYVLEVQVQCVQCVVSIVAQYDNCVMYVQHTSYISMTDTMCTRYSFVHTLQNAGLGIIHRDLKPENLLLTKDANTDQVTVKVIDFGLSKVLPENVQAKSFLGTRGYLAPEMLQRESYSKAVDVWALGVICFVLLCGCLPFDDDSSRINKKSAMAKFVLRFPRWAQVKRCYIVLL
jgi:serine/threonine protein kinase